MDKATVTLMKVDPSTSKFNQDTLEREALIYEQGDSGLPEDYLIKNTLKIKIGGQMEEKKKERRKERYFIHIDI